ncbi:hypothetical protein [Streptomyces sp. AC550_RSS872]|nr:hypothetical protein [Streptomyces sp. AC550_RSS872]
MESGYRTRTAQPARNDMYISGIESGTEVFKGAGRLDSKAHSVDIG